MIVLLFLITYYFIVPRLEIKVTTYKTEDLQVSMIEVMHNLGEHLYITYSTYLG